VGGRSNCDENHFRVWNSGSIIGAKSKVRSGFRQQFGQPGFIDRCFAGTQEGNLFFIRVDASNFVSQKGQAGSGSQSNIPGANDRYIHEFVVSLHYRNKAWLMIQKTKSTYF
jgi:hypothetical protein